MPGEMEQIHYAEVAPHVGHYLQIIERGPFGAPHTAVLRCMDCMKDIVSLANPECNIYEQLVDQTHESLWTKEYIMGSLVEDEDGEKQGDKAEGDEETSGASEDEQ